MIRGMVVGLIVLLALPAAGLASVALQATDEPPRRLNPNDLAAIGPQAGPGASAAGGASGFDPYAAPGSLLARGTNTQPSGPYQLLSYVLEEVTIPAGVQIPALAGRPSSSTVARLSVSGGPFPTRALPYVIWLDDVPLRFVVGSPDQRRLTVLVPDRSPVRNGAVISVSYGETIDVRQRLPEPLSLGSGSP